MRRFITLIDALYENKVLLLLLADTDAPSLLELDREARQSALYDEVSAFYMYSFIRLLIVLFRYLLLIGLCQDCWKCNRLTMLNPV
jgi:hypothetical protein